MEILINLIRLW